MKSVKVPKATKSAAKRWRAAAKSTARTCSASSRNQSLTAARSSGMACGVLGLIARPSGKLAPECCETPHRSTLLQPDFINHAPTGIEPASQAGATTLVNRFPRLLWAQFALGLSFPSELNVREEQERRPSG